MMNLVQQLFIGNAFDKKEGLSAALVIGSVMQSLKFILLMLNVSWFKTLGG